MEYISTRGSEEKLSFDEVLLKGLADDGGLYLPEEYPYFTKQEIREMRGLSYQELAFVIIYPFVKDVIEKKELEDIVYKSYLGFNHDAVAPLRQLGSSLWLTELYHGPTLAFKDYALQLVGNLFDYVLEKKQQKITIIGATSGDTGSAAIHACMDKSNMDVFILHPHNKVSEIQRKQMTTVSSSNIHNIALEGNFDDCQNMVKAMFSDEKYRSELNLSAVNSINWARIMAQVVYYFWSGIALGAPDNFTSFAVPTGNFGNIFAGYVAMKMGLPIGQLIIGSNANDILPRFVNSGLMEKKEVVASISPSMDIQISSNFERLLFEVLDRDSEKLVSMMEDFSKKGSYEVEKEVIDKIGNIFSAHSLDDEKTKIKINKIHQNTGVVLDPHSAIGVSAGMRKRQDMETPVVCLATAHPAKFADAVRASTGNMPEIPKEIEKLASLDEKYEVKPNDLDKIKAYIKDKTNR